MRQVRLSMSQRRQSAERRCDVPPALTKMRDGMMLPTARRSRPQSSGHQAVAAASNTSTRADAGAQTDHDAPESRQRTALERRSTRTRKTAVTRIRLRVDRLGALASRPWGSVVRWGGISPLSSSKRSPRIADRPRAASLGSRGPSAPGTRDCRYQSNRVVCLKLTREPCLE